MNTILIITLVVAIGICSWTRDRCTLATWGTIVIGLILVLTRK